MSAKRKDEKAEAMYELYQDGFSLDRVGKAFNVSRQSVYKMFKKRGFNLRSKPNPLPFIMLSKHKYTLRNTGYYGRTNGRRTLLHRDIWRKHNGQIPKRFDIHHIDGDKTNNDIANLKLVLRDGHASKYPNRKNQNIYKTHCKHGHKFTPQNTYLWHNHRICRTCTKLRARKKRAEQPTTDASK